MTVIEKGIPAPQSKCELLSDRVREVLAAMAAGDSALFTPEEFPYRNLESGIKVAVHRYQAGRSRVMSYVARKDGVCMRVWRTK